MVRHHKQRSLVYNTSLLKLGKRQMLLCKMDVLIYTLWAHWTLSDDSSTLHILRSIFHQAILIRRFKELLPKSIRSHLRSILAPLRSSTRASQLTTNTPRTCALLVLRTCSYERDLLCGLRIKIFGEWVTTSFNCCLRTMLFVPWT